MRVDIKPQWRKLAKWYWSQAVDSETVGMSIWDLLEHNYGARRGFSLGRNDNSPMWVVFPDEKMYTAFLLRWA